MNHQSKTKPHSSNLIALPFTEALSPTALVLPEKLTGDEWLEVGEALGRARSSVMWWVGDWWMRGEHQYGDRVSIVKSDDWDGPAFQTSADAAWVCRRIETSRRREVLSFNVHREVAALDQQWQDEVLTWAEDGTRTIKEIRERVKQMRAIIAQGWTPDQLDRKARVEAGECVVANIRENPDGRRIDEALLSWADAGGLFSRIDRKTEWGNPFEMPEDGERAEVVGKFSKFYLPHKDGLLSRISKLRGRVLGCWCHPEECHGHIIAEIVNREAAGEGTAGALADQLADVDG